jgi:hypothetical protein
MGLRKYARDHYGLTVPQGATKAEVIDLIINYVEENPDAL